MPNTRKPKSRARTRRARNLSLSDEAIKLGERYSASLGMSLSGLVDQMLRALPPEELPAEEELPPALRRLRRLLAREGPPVDWRQEYREHLTKKYLEGRDE